MRQRAVQQSIALMRQPAHLSDRRQQPCRRRQASSQDRYADAGARAGVSPQGQLRGPKQAHVAGGYPDTDVSLPTLLQVGYALLSSTDQTVRPSTPPAAIVPAVAVAGAEASQRAIAGRQRVTEWE